MMVSGMDRGRGREGAVAVPWEQLEEDAAVMVMVVVRERRWGLGLEPSVGLGSTWEAGRSSGCLPWEQTPQSADPASG